MIRLFLILFILPQAIFANSNMQKLENIKTLNKFIFASCNKEYKEQPLWPYINKDSPQLFVWGGDNIYGDKGPYSGNLKKKYEIQNAIAGYKELKSKAAIIGTWDDHDYGLNNSGANNPKKEENKQLFLDFMDVPKDSDRRERDGVYSSQIFGSGKTKVKFILLDVRFNRTQKGGVLGVNQTKWFEKQISNSDAQFHFIVSGVPFLPSKMIKTEEWADFPHSKKELLELIEKHKPKGLMFLSGDKHFAAITQKDNLIEVMSSGMTHKTNPTFRPWLRTRFNNPYFHFNYALFEILWDKKPIELKVSIKGVNKTVIEKIYTLKDRFLE